MNIPMTSICRPFSAGALVAVASAVLLALGQTSASAQTTYSLTGAGTWDTPTIWTPNANPSGPTASDSISFTGAGGTTVTLSNAVQTISSFSFNSAAGVDFASTTSGKTLAVTNDLTKDGTGTLFFRTNGNIPASLSVGGNLALNTGMLKIGEFGGMASTISVTGTTTVAAPATLKLTGYNTVGTFGQMTLNGTLNLGTEYGFVPNVDVVGLSGSGTFAIPVDANSLRTSTLTLKQASGSYDYSGVLSDNTLQKLQITKSAAGTQTLSGTNTYDGATTVNAGTLLINGDNSGATGAVSVALNAILGGSGTIGGNTTIAQGGILAAGTTADSTTTLALNTKDLIIAGTNSKLNFDITGTGAGAFDKVVGIASFTQNGDVTFQLSGAYGTNSWDVLDFASKTGNFDTVTLAGSYAGSLLRTGDVWAGTVGGQAWTFDQTSGVLGVVPEPSTWLLLAFGLTTVVTLRRRRA